MYPLICVCMLVWCDPEILLVLINRLVSRLDIGKTLQRSRTTCKRKCTL